MSKEKIQELIPTSDDDSGILRQARLDSNSQTTLPTVETKNEIRELLLVCVSQVRMGGLFILARGRYLAKASVVRKRVN